MVHTLTQFMLQARTLVIAVIFALTAMTAFTVTANAQAVDTTRDCDQYAVMYCGAMTKAEILKKLRNGDGRHSGADIRDKFSKMGISVATVENSKFVNGVVYLNGEVKVNGKVVATNAKTYIRTMGVVSTSKMGSAQAALVNLDSNGNFRYAIMTPCGNPVTAQPKVQPQPKVQTLKCVELSATPTNIRDQFKFTAKAATTNGANVSSYTFTFGDGNKRTVTTSKLTAITTHKYAKAGTYTAQVTVNGKANNKNVSDTREACKVKITIEEEKPPVVTPPEQPEQPEQPQPEKEVTPQVLPAEVKEMPKTGAGSLLALFGGTSALGAIGHRFYLKRRMR